VTTASVTPSVTRRMCDLMAAVYADLSTEL
jgi:hypothetical protein